MSLTSIERTNLIKLTVGMFGAAPGATYLAEITGLYEANGRSLLNVAKILADTPAYKALNPVFQTAAEFTAEFLTPLGLQANTEAVEYVTAKFTAGVSKGQIALDALTALNNSTAPAFADARAILNNKTAVAEYYSVTKEIAQTNLGTLQQVISTVTKDVASVAAANTAIDNGSGAAAGNTFTLTNSVDVLTGTAGNDTFIGDNTQTNGSVGAGDQINGGAGTDTFNYFVLPAGGAVVAPQLNAVENVNLIGITTAGITANFTNTVGLQQVTLKDTTTAASVITVGAGVAAGLDNVKTAGAETFTFTATQTAATVNVVNGTNVAGVLALDGALITTLNVVSATGAANTIASLQSTGTETTLNVSGAGNITIGAVGATLTTINAAAATGTTSIDASATTGNVAYTGGTANDTIKFGASLTVGDVVNGGTGVNTLGVTVGSTLVTGLQVTNVQTLDVGGANTGAVTASSTNSYDLSKLAGITTLAVGSAINTEATPVADDTVTINNLAKGAAVQINAALGTGTGDILAINVKDAGAGSPNDTIGVTVSGAAAVTTGGDLVIADIETVNLTASTTATTPITHVISALNVNQALTVAVLNGNAGLTITDLNNTSLVLLDATAATQVVSVTTAGGTAFTATNGIAFKMGAGADVLDLTGSISAGTLTGSKFFVSGNGGGDTITLTAANIDPDAGGALGTIGNQETLVFTAAADSQSGVTATGVNKFDTINNFDAETVTTTTSDFIDLKAFTFTSTQAAAFAKTVGTAITATGGVATADTTSFFVNAGSKVGVAVVAAGTDVWLFVDADKDGSYSATADMAIKLVGVTAADVTTADFTFA